MKEEKEMICEFGSSSAFRFIKASDVKIINEDGSSSEYPVCEKCGIGMTFIISKIRQAWVCAECEK